MAMTYPGSDKKYKVEVAKVGFHLAEDDFEIVIRDGYGRVKRRLKKYDCFYDKDGNFYFTLEDLRPGPYYAYFRGSYEDLDYDKQRRVFTDAQLLLEVDMPAHRRCRRRHVVRYTEVWTVSVDGIDYLADCDGRYIMTSDGKRIAFTSDVTKKVDNMGRVQMKMTGEEFLQKWEGKNPNDEIDTVPEMLEAARGIRDDETIHHHTEEQIDDYLDEEAATNDDIDEMF